MEYKEIICEDAWKACCGAGYPLGAFKFKSKNTELYSINRKLHREGEPAYIEYHEGTGKIKIKEYFLNNKYYRVDGPAINHYYSNGTIRLEEYYLNDQLHREDGMAFIEYDENRVPIRGFYFLFGGGMSKEEWENQIQTKLYW